MEKNMGLDSVRESARKCHKKNRDWRWRQIKPGKASRLYKIMVSAWVLIAPNEATTQ